ncbi:MAG: hypothetical protein JWR88_406 [Pseudonocardia sp.]|jgi:DNA-binding protein HU-beta|nr:hypothetical protein [Pseudonocardia sp.]
MNKAQLVAALADRLGDRGAAALAVDELLDVIVRAVHAGDSVTISGFGVFERRERAARTGRNPQTGAAIQLAATSVPAFRAGASFRDVVSGVRTLPTAVPPAATAARPPVTTSRTLVARPAAKPATRPVPVAAAAPSSTGGLPRVDGAQRSGKTVGKSGAKGKSKSLDVGRPGARSNDDAGASGSGKGARKAGSKGADARSSRRSEKASGKGHGKGKAGKGTGKKK